MKPLAELAAALPAARIVGAGETPIERIEFDIDRVRPGDLYVAIVGHVVDGHGTIARAVAAGARAVACERIDSGALPDVPCLVVPDTIEAMGLMAHAFHDFPSRRMRVVGVTGTNGKTTTATLLHGLFERLGHASGLFSTIRNLAGGDELEWTHTIGHALQISGHMARMVAAGCSHCFLEATSQAVDQNRLAGVAFDGGIFTNLTHDHLDYHGGMAAYAQAKKAFFDTLPAGSFALAYADDPRGGWMLSDSPAERCFYGTGGGCDFAFQILSEGLDGLALRIDGRTIRSRLIGAFNASNLAAAYAAARLLGEDGGEVAAALAEIPPVEGRMQRIAAPDGRIAIVDYAHSPDAVEKALRSLVAARRPDGRILTVIGCGGDCDAGKRPIMGAAAARHSDRLFLTSDNPRMEDPAKILAEIEAGVPPVLQARLSIVPDRRAAIFAACADARPGDLVLVAGKGHERYQEIGRRIYPFDDAAVAREAFGIA